MKRPSEKRYRLSLDGLRSLRASVYRVKPWTRSTGPRTLRGKRRSKMNALKHGERSARAIAVRKEINLAFRILRSAGVLS